MPKRKGLVTFRENRCKGCGLCIDVCPVKIVALNRGTTNERGYNPASIEEMDKCIACTNCALICPDLVITVETKE
ncbi:MAG: 4Fe-4S binding protein [Clostridiales bacterium]|nr:4Fe-4S binding protein [Clostridiales bacterium]